MFTKVILEEKDLPTKWYNINADMPKPMDPPLHPGTKKPIGPADLAPIFPMNLIEQEVSTKRWIDIPQEILDVYALWRPSPLYRAKRLEAHLKTPAKIFYKYEGVSPAGSHKPNTAVAQAYYNKQAGIKKISTETGAGQWGSALAFAGNLFGVEILVYMVKISYEQKPYRKHMMNTWGAKVIPSPSNTTKSGQAVLAKDPNSPGSLGIAISEAVEVAATNKDTNYSLGSVLNHVCMHQTVVGQETALQLKKAGIKKPDIIIGCVGGGSNFAGIAFPFMPRKFAGEDIRFIAVEPTACPTLTKGLFAYDFGDLAQLTPLVKMFTLGHDFVPPPIHSGGLRYHGMAPQVSHLVKLGLIEAQAYHQKEVFEAAITFARTEGIIVAPESAHAVKATIKEALIAKAEGKEKVIVFNLSGHGHFDLASYEKYLSGNLEDYAYPEDKIKEAMNNLPKI
ncbi:MAG: TrpB-like pyridoxal phosphate-dependent enzyme [Candidatus Margulisbacteria bacterium]|nr:TrpB-like pyridoxal phosphate-dependent enzyme [Candidatus Margulisiibacteriota bacterium]